MPWIPLKAGSDLNILAHLYLSGEEAELMIGNFIADHIRGKQQNTYNQGIQNGIKLHRFIDSFTDQNPVVLNSRKILYREIGKYAPVVSDVLFDHFLAKLWSDFHHETLEFFADTKYIFLQNHQHLMPDKTKNMLPFLIKYNWLVAYRSFEGLQQVFNGMNRRASFTSNMDQSVIILEKYYADFEASFKSFFPELVYESNKYIQSL